MNTLWTALMEPIASNCRTVARWPADRRRDHSAAGITATAGFEAPQGAKRGGYCGGPTAGESENYQLRSEPFQELETWLPIFHRPLGRTLRPAR